MEANFGKYISISWIEEKKMCLTKTEIKNVTSLKKISHPLDKNLVI